jgi:UDP-N-acetyl-D-glucosamine dehydrogenase
MSDLVRKSCNAAQAIGLAKRIEARSSHIGIIGMGYVGLPLAVTTYIAGYSVLGFDVDPLKISMLNGGESPIGRIDKKIVAEMRASGRFEVTKDYARLAECDVIVLCVPTPLNKYREPDLSYVTGTTRSLAPYLRQGQLIALESTTYPGTTREIMRPILEAGGLKSGHDFFMAFSPEREDPGNPNYHTATIPKVVGGDGPDASLLASLFYGSVVKRVVEVSSCEVAEAVKLTENIFRSVNIALVNELKIIYDRMGIDVWEVIEAAKTKPFGYMAFYPGPGLGGHCIPIDPFYLTWKAREYNVHTRFIELAGEINTMAPVHVVEKLIDALSHRKQKSLSGAKILMFGVAYKKNVEDTRESPAFRLIQLIEEKGGTVDFYDPYVPQIPHMREHAEMSGRRSITFNADHFGAYDAALVCTDHDNVDYLAIADAMDLVIDTRNAMKAVVDRAGIVRA